MKSLAKRLLRPVFHALPVKIKHWLRPPLARVPTPENTSKPISEIFSEAGIPPLDAYDFNHLLHYLRGKELAKLPKDIPRFISVGCSGTWYFNWIQKLCSPQNHIGIEYYSPKPDDLPDNVEWIANTAGDMSSIADGFGDVLFSGQNIEHLWPQDVVNFLLESHRALGEKGMLIIDSPNRSITKAQVWSHPEHILELTVDEVVQMIAVAGFDLTALRGMWLCEAPDSGLQLKFDDLTDQSAWPLARRIEVAANQPDRSFCWWLEARKSSRSPDRAKLEKLVNEAFKVAWPERVNRLLAHTSTCELIDGQEWLLSKNQPGVLMFGPYMPLPKGRYRVGFMLNSHDHGEPRSSAVLRIDVVDGLGQELASANISNEQLAQAERVFDLEFSLPATTFGIQFRVISLDGGAYACRRMVRFESKDAPLYSAI